MNAAELASLALFALVMSITPGPNNLMLAALGLAQGIRRTLPAWAGALVGVVTLLVFCGLGAAAVATDPRLQTPLRLAAAAYLVWLGWKLFCAGAPQERPISSPVGFWAAAVLQVVNPKAWLMAASAIALYVTATEEPVRRLALVAVMFAVIGAPSSFLWVGGAAGLRSFLRTPRRLKLFNRLLALLCIIAAALMLI